MKIQKLQLVMRSGNGNELDRINVKNEDINTTLREALSDFWFLDEGDTISVEAK